MIGGELAMLVRGMSETLLVIGKVMLPWATVPTKGLHTVAVEAAAVATSKRVVTKTVATESVKSVTA